MLTKLTHVAAAAVIGLFMAVPAAASPFFFSTGSPDGRMATATRPPTAPFEIESADDFVLTAPTSLTSASFTGLVPSTGSPSVTQVVVEIYRVFPNDSNTIRTPLVPSRTNSPSDDAFTSRDSSAGGLNFATSLLTSGFTALNTVRPGGISLGTGGNGPFTGQEVEFGVSFTTPLTLPAGHYFFVPQVLLSDGDFLWLSAPRPIVSPGTPFPPGFTDLQSWTRDASLDPDWLRVGQDIVGGSPFPTFNATFSLTGATVPEPMTLALFGAGLAGLAGLGLIRRKRRI